MLRSHLPEVLIASAALVLSSCGGERAERVVLSEHAQRIEGGALAPAQTSVVGMFVNGDAFSGVCSGTLIAQNLVLTARHCVSAELAGGTICGQASLGAPSDAQRQYVTTDLQMSEQGNWYQGSRILVAPGGDDTCGYDMAMLVLAESVPSSATIPYSPRIDLAPRIDEPYTAVGYGEIGVNGDVGTRMQRSGLNVLCAVGTCRSYSADVTDTEFQGDTGTCLGDSGGPALDVENRVIGVLSRGLRDSCAASIYSSVSAWGEWIRQGAMSAAQLGGYEPPRWAVTGSTAAPAPAPAPAPVPSEPVSGGQGDECSATQACADGFLCVYDTTPSDAFCSARCDASTPCASGFTCSAELGACMPLPRAARSNDGCSVSPLDRSAPPPVRWLAGLAVAGLGALRRRGRRRATADGPTRMAASADARRIERHDVFIGPGCL